MPPTPGLGQPNCSSRECVIEVELSVTTQHLEIEYRATAQTWSLYQDSVSNHNGSDYSENVANDNKKWSLKTCEVIARCADSNTKADMSVRSTGAKVTVAQVPKTSRKWISWLTQCSYNIIRYVSNLLSQNLARQLDLSHVNSQIRTHPSCQPLASFHQS